MREQGQVLAYYKVARGHYVKVLYEDDWFTIWEYHHESNWLRAYRCKDFLKCAEKLKELI